MFSFRSVNTSQYGDSSAVLHVRTLSGMLKGHIATGGDRDPEEYLCSAEQCPEE